MLQIKHNESIHQSRPSAPLADLCLLFDYITQDSYIIIRHNKLNNASINYNIIFVLYQTNEQVSYFIIRH